jgi:hypothetical protein
MDDTPAEVALDYPACPEQEFGGGQDLQLSKLCAASGLRRIEA